MPSPQLTPDQAALLLGSLLPSLQTEHHTTKAVIAAIPPDKGDYRPDAVSRTALDLAWHIVSAEKRFLNAIAAGAFDLTPMPRPDSMTTPAAIDAWFDEAYAENLRKLQALDGQALVKVIDFRGMFQLPAIAFLQISLNHSIHHRGQLTMYLRPMGAKVPSIYGESYDATQERLAKKA